MGEWVDRAAVGDGDGAVVAVRVIVDGLLVVLELKSISVRFYIVMSGVGTHPLHQRQQVYIVGKMSDTSKAQSNRRLPS